MSHLIFSITFFCSRMDATKHNLSCPFTAETTLQFWNIFSGLDRSLCKWECHRSWCWLCGWFMAGWESQSSIGRTQKNPQRNELSIVWLWVVVLGMLWEDTSGVCLGADIFPSPLSFQESDFCHKPTCQPKHLHLKKILFHNFPQAHLM